MTAIWRLPSNRPRGPASETVSNSPAKARARPALEVVGLGGREEPDRAVVDPEDRDFGARIAPQGAQDRPVAAEREAEVDVVGMLSTTV